VCAKNETMELVGEFLAGVTNFFQRWAAQTKTQVDEKDAEARRTANLLQKQMKDARMTVNLTRTRYRAAKESYELKRAEWSELFSEKGSTDESVLVAERVTSEKCSDVIAQRLIFETCRKDQVNAEMRFSAAVDRLNYATRCRCMRLVDTGLNSACRGCKSTLVRAFKTLQNRVRSTFQT
jgi:hypothetical protein